MLSEDRHLADRSGHRWEARIHLCTLLPDNDRPLRESNTQDQAGIKWTGRKPLHDLEFADDTALFGSNRLALQGLVECSAGTVGQSETRNDRSEDDSHERIQGASTTGMSTSMANRSRTLTNLLMSVWHSISAKADRHKHMHGSYLATYSSQN